MYTSSVSVSKHVRRILIKTLVIDKQNNATAIKNVLNARFKTIDKYVVLEKIIIC